MASPAGGAPPKPISAAPLAGAASGGVAPWPTLVVVAAGLFLAVLSTTAVSVALPSIGHDLGATATDLEWTVDAYVLVYASLLVPGGVAGDRRGRKSAFILGVALFGLGSLAAGLAPATGLLLAGRVVQGTGPALLVPASLAIIRATFTDDRQRAMAIGLWSTSSGIAMAVGPAVGGVIVGTLGWRWVLLLNVPLTAALVALAARLVPRLPRPGAVRLARRGRVGGRRRPARLRRHRRPGPGLDLGTGGSALRGWRRRWSSLRAR